MKLVKYIIALFAVFSLTSCFQDLGQNPPFDYPQQPPPPPLGADGQIFYMSFDSGYEEYQSLSEAMKEGTPTFAEGKKGKAYAGAKNSYLTFGLPNMAAPLKTAVTFGFWYKVNASPDRAGILVISPKTEGKPADKQNNRTSGIRIFRENASGKQLIKANVGNGESDTWLSGKDKDALDPANPTWKYITLVLTEGKATLFIDAEEVASTNLSKVSWNGCDIMSIGSGAPRFTEWGHLSDNSLIDELRIYNKALTPTEIKAAMVK